MRDRLFLSAPRPRCAGSPIFLNIIEERIQPFRRRNPEAELSKSSPEYEGLTSFGIMGGKRRRQPTALRETEHSRSLRTCRVHHRASIRLSMVGDPVRQARASLSKVITRAKAASLRSQRRTAVLPNKRRCSKQIRKKIRGRFVPRQRLRKTDHWGVTTGRSGDVRSCGHRPN